MFGLYNFLTLLIALFAWPILLFKKKARVGVGQKFGFVPANIVPAAQAGDRPVWFHAVSVGEFNAVWPLISAFHDRHPERRLIISNTTGTGHELACQRASAIAEMIFFPYDLPWATANWLRAVDPAAVVIVETELWPGFYSQCRSRNIPLMIVNGRISPRSFRRHSRIKPLIGAALRCVSLIAAQTDEESARYRALAGDGPQIEVTGNLKFDGLKSIDDQKKRSLKEKVGLASQPVLVAGSTHEGEESAVLAAAKYLQEQGQDLTLIIAPRHPERFDRAGELIASYGFRVRRFSKDETIEQANDVYLLDAIGHLADFYSLSTIAFVGGTLVNIGGHNLMEPYAYAVPVICGPHIEKTRDVANALSELDAIAIVQNEKELRIKCLELIKDAQMRQSMAKRGQDWLKKSQGAVSRAIALLDALLMRDNPACINDARSDAPRPYSAAKSTKEGGAEETR